MSIKALALDLYRAKLAVDKLEKTHENACQGEKTALGQELKMAQNELAMLRRMLEGKKDSGFP